MTNRQAMLPLRTTTRGLVAGLLVLILAAGCTSITGTPSQDGAAGSGGGSGGVASSIDPAGNPNVGDETSDAPPTSTDLIAAALEAGEIDEPTSLLYRTWVYFGDWQLPEKYIGADAPYELGLIAEVRDKLDGMPTEIRAQVEPYLLRPEDQKSAFNAQDTGGVDPPGLRGTHSGRALVEVGGVTGDLAAADLVREGETKKPARRCATGWDTASVDGINFRVWACRDADALPGISTDDAMAKVATMLQEHVPKMTADMGELLPDDPSTQPDKRADERVDVYVLPTGWLGPVRGGSADEFPNYAVTVSMHPGAGKTMASYVLISSNHFDDMPLLERMVVHELFHAYQRIHNGLLNAAWWVEGSAEWAASYYVRSDSARLHDVRLDQVMDVIAPSILVLELRQRYGAYIWPLFMEQERGAKSVFDAWRAMAGLEAGATDAAVIGVLDQQVPVAEKYPELAVRLVNTKLPGDPITPRFRHLDSNFPEGRTPRMDDITLEKDLLELPAAAMFGLGYRDFSVTVEPPPDHPKDAGVVVRVTGTAKTESGKVSVLQALVRGTDREYKRVPVDFTGDGEKLCVDKHLVLVLANNSTVKLDLTEGTLTLERLDDEPCARIEASNPSTLERLENTDLVEVAGQEGDGQPDSAPLVISIFDVPPEDVADYSVRVTLTGGTLAGARDLEWPLADFDEVSPGVFRMTQTVALDIDLTDANRDFTIDARLLHDTDDGEVKVDEHEPTVKLHGDEQCGARVTYVTNDDPDDPLTMSWDCEGRAALLQNEGQTIITDSGTQICSYEDRDCMEIPGGGTNMFPHLGFYMELDEAQGLLTQGDDAGKRTIAGVDTACRTLNAGGADGHSTWCVDPANPQLLLYWVNLDTGESLTATAVGNPRPGDFIPFGGTG